MFQQVGANDIALIGSLLYFCVDLWSAWSSFTCQQPVHLWLLVSCACAIAFRVIRMLTPASSSGSGGGVSDLLLDLPLKGSWSATVTWALAAPFFTLWTYVGTYWVWDSFQDMDTCMGDTYLWFSLAWLALCHIWVFVHAALWLRTWRSNQRAHRLQANLRGVEDDESRQRWGEISSGPEAGRRWAGTQEGLSADVVLKLPCETWSSEQVLGRCECAICLSDFQEGDRVRTLPTCGHTFHKGCIDLWLVRQAECPLCKRTVC